MMPSVLEASWFKIGGLIGDPIGVSTFGPGSRLAQGTKPIGSMSPIRLADLAGFAAVEVISMCAYGEGGDVCPSRYPRLDHSLGGFVPDAECSADLLAGIDRKRPRTASR
jgi:hypothetical protein